MCQRSHPLLLACCSRWRRRQWQTHVSKLVASPSGIHCSGCISNYRLLLAAICCFEFTSALAPHSAALFAGSKGLNRKTVSFVITDLEVQQRLVEDLQQPAPPSKPRAERGFIRNHFPHLRRNSHGDKKQRQEASSNQVVPEGESFDLSQQNSNSFASGDDDLQGDSLSAVLLANSQPLSHRSGSLDRPPSLQKASLRLSASYSSKPLLANDAGRMGRQGMNHGSRCFAECCISILPQGHLLMHADGDVEALLDIDQQDLLPMIKGEDGSILLPKGPRWPQPRRRSSLINNPLAIQLADSLSPDSKSRNATRAEQYSPPSASAYGSALVSELRQDDESFFSDKSDMESEAPTLAAALGARRSSLLMPTPSNPSATESMTSMRRKPLSRHVSHIGYSQPGKVLSRLRRSSNGDDDMFPVKMRRRSDETSMVFSGVLQTFILPPIVCHNNDVERRSHTDDPMIKQSTPGQCQAQSECQGPIQPQCNNQHCRQCRQTSSIVLCVGIHKFMYISFVDCSLGRSETRTNVHRSRDGRPIAALLRGYGQPRSAASH